MMTHDISFRAPEEIVAGIGGADAHGYHSMVGSMPSMAGMTMLGDHSDHSMDGMHNGSLQRCR